MAKLHLLYLLSFFILIACKVDTEQKTRKPEIVYEVFVQSFRDSNGDGIGDLQGLISKLDYIHDLGATAVWIMPFHPSPSYHKYDVSDYYGVHADYGTMEDLEQLIAELHKRNMKFIMDFVVNHTSAEHPWFVESVTSRESPYHDYYVWRDYDSVQNEINKKTTTFDSDNITQWHPGNDDKDRYYGFFWKGMPDLNFDNSNVRNEIYTIGKFWIDKGVDGFRLDAAKHIYPDDRFDDTRLFWEEFTDKMKLMKPDILIIGEVWSDPATLATLFKGLPSLFNFELTRAIPQMINTGDKHAFVNSYNSISSAYHNKDVPFDDAIILSNHDMTRIRSTLNHDIEKSKIAASILLTLPGTPYIYYGEEIGMLGTKPDPQIREPFLWGDSNFKDTSWMVPVHSIPGQVTPVQEQSNDPLSILNHYKTWISLRKQNPTLAFGELNMIHHDHQDLLLYSINDQQNTYIIAHNIGSQTIPYSLPAKSQIISHHREDKKEETFHLLPFSSVVMTIKE